MLKDASKSHPYKLKLLVTTAVLMLAGCSGADKGGVATSSPATATPAALRNFEAEMAPVITARMKELHVPGAIIGVWARGYQPWLAAYGVSDLSGGRAMTVQDATRIGSITKTVTATVVAQMVDEGKVGFDEPVSKYLTGVPNGENISVRQLGDMSSGLFNYTEDSKFQETLSKNPDKKWTPDECLAIAFKHKPYFAPGKGFHYSNTNTFLLGKIAEKISGRSLAEEMSSRIFVPLKMTRTLLAMDAKMTEPFTHGYSYDDDIQPPKPPRDDTFIDPTWGWAAGAIVSTVDDLKTYAKALGTGQLVSAKTQAERMKWFDQPQNPNGKFKELTSYYGFGMTSIAGALGHNGSLPGYQSFMGYIPDQDATVIVFANIQHSPDGVTPADDFAVQILRAMTKK